MDLPMMNLAQHHQVRQFRLTTTFPFTNVVDLAPGRRAPAPRVGASAVPGGDGPTQTIRDGAADPADVERLAEGLQTVRQILVL